MCHWFNDKTKLWKVILNFTLITNDENYSKFNISPTLGLKSKESPSKNPFIKGFLIISRVDFKFPKIFFVSILLNFLWQNCSIFNHPCTIGLNIMKLPWYTSTHWRLSNDTKNNMVGTKNWKFSMWQIKQNKQTTFLSK